ncbi:MAG: monofunctional biosynthetic peptidoglycan transglycosylase [Gemmatimonadaceae bacterium]
MRPILQRLRRLALWGILVVLVGPFLLILPLNFVQPLTTTVMLWRSVQRLSEGKRPVYPRRDVVSHEQISPFLHRAVLASEDDRFFLHEGFDFEELEKAIDASKHGKKLRGASTITQQVAKNLFLWEGRSFIRKGLEAWLTIVLELCLSKDRILDLYLNLAEWGDGIFGAEMASQTYYHKPAARLTREEAARLAAILPSPRRWSPSGGIASRRAEIILRRMQYAAPREEEAASQKSPRSPRQK